MTEGEVRGKDKGVEGDSSTEKSWKTLFYLKGNRGIFNLVSRCVTRSAYNPPQTPFTLTAQYENYLSYYGNKIPDPAFCRDRA